MALKNKIKWLASELPRLVDEGVMSNEIKSNIEKHYQEQLKVSSDSMFNKVTVTLSILSAVLFSAGICLLINHNWDMFSIAWKNIFTFIPLLVATILGSYTLMKKKSALWREFSGILTVGAVAAAIAIISQTYNMGGELKDYLFLVLFLMFPLLYIFRSMGVFLLYLIAIIVWKGSANSLFGNMEFDNSVQMYFLIFTALGLPFLLLVNRVKSLKNSAIFCNFIAILFAFSIGGIYKNTGQTFLMYLSLSIATFFFGQYLFNKDYKIIKNLCLTLGIISQLIIAMVLFEGNFQAFFFNDITIIAGIMIAFAIFFLIKNFSILNCFILGTLIMPFIIAQENLDLGRQTTGWIYVLYFFIIGIIALFEALKKVRFSLFTLGLGYLAVITIRIFFDSKMDTIFRGLLAMAFSIILAVLIFFFTKKYRSKKQEVK